MYVKELMTPTPSACRITDSATEAARIMWDRDCGAVPVVDGDGRVAGIVTDRDICMAAYFKGVPLSAISVASIMSRDVTTCRADDDLGDAGRLMRDRQIRRLPVVGDGRALVGMLSLGDVAQGVRDEPPTNGEGEEFIETVATISEPRDHSRRPAAARH